MKFKLQFSVAMIMALAAAFPALADTNAGGSQVKADNTAINVRDRNQKTLTPLAQGNHIEDIGTTAGIRRDIMGHKGMSVDAQNVKIITQYGEVTLRGPVKTAEEKKFIGKSARSRINPENVDNQLQVVGDSKNN